MKFGVILILIFCCCGVFAFSITGMGVTGNLSLGVEDNNAIVILSPLNITYDFEPDEDFLIDLNVSSILDISGWKYSLYDLSHGYYVKTETAFVPNSTIEAVRRANRLTVFGRSGQNWISKDVVFYVNVTNSAPILGDIDDEILVCESSVLSYTFNATDLDEDILYPDISPKNPFYTIYLNSVGNKSFFRIFSNVLNKNNLGIHPEIVSANDFYSSSCCVDSKSTNITVIEINNPPRMIGLGAQTVWTRGDNSNFYHQMDVNDVEDGNTNDGNLRFNLSFSGNENLFSIDNYYGIMNYTPSGGDIGVYSARVCARDRPLSSAHVNISYCLPNGNWSESACDNFTITVTDQNRAPQIINYTPSQSNLSANSTDILSFYARVRDPDGTVPDIDWYVDGLLKEHNEEQSEDNFSYIFGCNIFGNHTVKIVATDGLLNATVEWNVSVNLIACPPVQERAGGGGGGGGGGGKYCFEKWACLDWEVCQNLKRSYDAKMIEEEDYYNSKEICAQENYDEKSCGFQIRNCADLENCSNVVFRVEKPSEYQICQYSENPNCGDGIKNCHDGKCELLVDCGGPCAICPSCSDKIQNQGELGVDCGGPCPYMCEEEKPLFTNWMFLILILIFLLIIIFIIWKLRNIRRYNGN